MPADTAAAATGTRAGRRAALEELLRRRVAVLDGAWGTMLQAHKLTPEDYTGSVIGDLNSRRGQIQGQDMRGNANVVTAMVPLQNMFGYVSNLRSMSQGRATFTMQFDRYEDVPQSIAADIVDAQRGE